MKHDPKQTNPKDAIGSSKIHLDLVPDSMVLFASLGFAEGALKYGKFNWRAAGVRLSIYMAALERHKMKFMAGEWADPETGVPHLSSMLACIGIIVDAHVSDKLNDDRPPMQPNLNVYISEAAKAQAHLKELFRDCNPHQHTIMDAFSSGYEASGVDTRDDAARDISGSSGGSAAGGVQPGAGEGRDA